MYLIETHLHTQHASSCGKLDAEAIASGYAKAGYDAIFVTDHYSPYNFGKQQWSTSSAQFRLEQFLEGYYRVKEAARPYGITVFRGAEMRFTGCPNDYLMYNYCDEMLLDPQSIFDMGVAAFHRLCQSNGALLIQAHPYREVCTPADPTALDGVEIFNLHPRHDSQNHLAQAFANANPHLIQLSGSDCHQAPDIGLGGVYMDVLPKDEKEFADLLRQGAFRLKAN